MNALSALRADPGAVLAIPRTQPALRECVAQAVRRYFVDLGSHEPGDLYDLVLREVEAPLLLEAMRYCDGNQSRAAAVLGINRSTLRKKLRQYGLA